MAIQPDFAPEIPNSEFGAWSRAKHINDTKGFDVATIAKAAYDIYQEHGLELTKFMGHTLLMLMAMEEGPEFELTETEFLALISEIKTI